MNLDPGWWIHTIVAIWVGATLPFLKTLVFWLFAEPISVCIYYIRRRLHLTPIRLDWSFPKVKGQGDPSINTIEWEVRFVYSGLTFCLTDLEITGETSHIWPRGICVVWKLERESTSPESNRYRWKARVTKLSVRAVGETVTRTGTGSIRMEFWASENYHSEPHPEVETGDNFTFSLHLDVTDERAYNMVWRNKLPKMKFSVSGVGSTMLGYEVRPRRVPGADWSVRNRIKRLVSYKGRTRNETVDHG